MIVARDIAHSKLKNRLDKGKKLPDYFLNHPIYYAGPAKTPKGLIQDPLAQLQQVEWTHLLKSFKQREQVLLCLLKEIDPL